MEINLSTDKIKDINLLDPLPYEEPILEEVELVEEQIIEVPETENDQKKESDKGDEEEDPGQITLF